MKIARSVLPCDHPIRIVVPSLFTHCDCSYSTWSNWIAVEGSIAKVPNSQCSSGETYQEERTRVVTGGSECNERLNETRHTCKLYFCSNFVCNSDSKALSLLIDLHLVY